MVIESRYPGKRLISLFLPLFILLVFILFPFYWTFITSVKPESELYGAVTYWPHSITFVAYQKLFTTTVNFFAAMKNSLIVARPPFRLPYRHWPHTRFRGICLSAENC